MVILDYKQDMYGILYLITNEGDSLAVPVIKPKRIGLKKRKKYSAGLLKERERERD